MPFVVRKFSQTVTVFVDESDVPDVGTPSVMKYSTVLSAGGVLWL